MEYTALASLSPQVVLELLTLARALYIGVCVAGMCLCVFLYVYL